MEVELQGHTSTRVRSRLFVALYPPVRVRDRLKYALEKLEPHLASVIPEERWHVTLCYLGEVAAAGQYVELLSQPLSQQFQPVVTLSSIGRGLAGDQLWAFALQSSVLQNMQHHIAERIGQIGVPVQLERVGQNWTPHLTLGRFDKGGSRLSTLDQPLQETFTVDFAHVLRSESDAAGTRYHVEGLVYLGG